MRIINYQEALKAIEQDITNIINVPDFLINKEIMQVIYKKDPSFKFVNYEHIYTVLTNPKRYKVIKIKRIYSHNYYEENKDLIPEKYDLSVMMDGNNLRHIPINERTPTLCLTALLQNPLALQFVPEELKTDYLCKISVEKSGMALEYVPKEKRTLELCYIAINRSLLCWDDIPEYIQKGGFDANLDNIIELKCYIRFTPRRRQKKEYLKAFFNKASYEEIKFLAEFIASKAIPTHLLPLLINIPNYRLRKYAIEKLKRG